ncbi:MAG: hypothetical protein Q7S02_03820, partial [bacterium]|nr:hypothetical protein [bacterium]
MRYDFRAIEQKWQERWAREYAFEARDFGVSASAAKDEPSGRRGSIRDRRALLVTDAGSCRGGTPEKGITAAKVRSEQATSGEGKGPRENLEVVPRFKWYGLVEFPYP